MNKQFLNGKIKKSFLLPLKVYGIADDIWEEKGKIKFLRKKQEDGTQNFQYLNPNRKATERIIFHGFYENDIPVAIERIQKNIISDQEIKRAVYVLRGLQSHENFIRYFSYETDNDFKLVAK